MTDWQHEETACLVCGRRLNGAAEVSKSGVAPGAGDFSVCAFCDAVTVYTGRGAQVRPLTPAEVAEAVMDPNVRRAIVLCRFNRQRSTRGSN